MAVHSDTFGGLCLSGDDASKFRRQVRSGRVSSAAKGTADRARLAVKQLMSSGRITVDTKAK
jgi:hypothetical protein